MIVNFKELEPSYPKYIPQFMDMLVDTLRSEVMSHLNTIGLSNKESALLDATWMMWHRKPKRINMVRVANLILHHLQWQEVDQSMYEIHIDPRIQLPGSSNSLQQIARWIEHGDENNSKPMLFINHAESIIRPRVPEYWKAFIQSKEGAVRIHECIHVR